MQVGEPRGAYSVFLLHGWHLEAPRRENVLAGQGRQWSRALWLYVPGLHGVQEDV